MTDLSVIGILAVSAIALSALTWLCGRLAR